LFQRYSQDITQFTEFDRESIMLYPIPNDLTIGDYEVGWNTALSACDKEFIGTIYPMGEPPVVELPVGAPPTAAAIGRHEEEDLFRFTAPTAGKYVVETQGWTNVVLRLCGPDDRAKVIAEDDNGGFLFNARIAAQLGPGAYYVTVRHRRPTGTGSYGISVRMMP
jgi:tyrosinase